MRVQLTDKIGIEPKRVTLRTVDELKMWKERLIAQAKKSTPQSVESVLALLEAFPELAEMTDIAGNIKADYLTKRMAELQMESEDEAREYAINEAQKKVLQIAFENKEVARGLFFPDVAYGTDKESITLGIDCIKATCDVDKLKAEQKDLIASEITSDFWQDIDGKAVAEYANKFCEYVK